MQVGNHKLRRAQRADIPALRAMHARSLRRLGAGFYSAADIEGIIARVSTLDAAVVEEGHYSVVEAADGDLLGSGGWSRLLPGYAGATGERRLLAGSALVRSVFVDPSAARQGIGSAIMGWAEADAAAQGVTQLRLKATLAGVPLYARLGFRTVARGELDLGDGLRFAYVDMAKRVAVPRERAA